MKYGAIAFACERGVQLLIPVPYGLRYNKTLRNGPGVAKDGSDAFSLSLSLLLDAQMRIGASMTVY